MLYEYSKLIFYLKDSLVEFFVFIVPLIGIILAYLLVRKYFLKHIDKGFFQRVIVPSVQFTLLSLVLVLFSFYIARFINYALVSTSTAENDFYMAFFIFYWSIPVIVIVFVLSLFIFGFRKITVIKDSSQYLNKKERDFIWAYFLIIMFFSVLYLPAYILENKIVEERNYHSELIKLDFANKNSDSVNEYVCIYLNELHDPRIISSFSIKNNALLNYSDVKVADINNDKIIFLDHDHRPLLNSCYNNVGENLGEKYTII